MSNRFTAWINSWINSLFVKPDIEVQAQAISIPYQMNDPTTPNLVKNVPLPPRPEKLDFSVKGYNRGVVRPGTDQHRAASCYITVAESIKYMQDQIARSRQPIQRWAAVQKLHVVPNAGRKLNAYYDRHALRFFWEVDPKTKKPIFTADSVEIVAHELGHALLDAMRPDFWSVQALEIWSFHEAFADITSMLTLMQHDEILEHVITETKGNLSLPNVVSRIGEEMGNTLHHMGARGKGALRNATNKFLYVNPGKLPPNAPPNQLAAECHSFGRIFMGAWYDLLVAIYDMEKAKKGQVQALMHARDVASGYLLKAIPNTPRTIKYYNAIARVMLSMDKAKGSPYQKVMKKIFVKRRILKPRVKLLSNTIWGDLDIEKGDEIYKKNDLLVVRLCRPSLIKLSDVTGEISGLSVGDHDLSKLDLEVPADHYYEFENGVLTEEITPDPIETQKEAYSCVMSIMKANAIGNTDETMWEEKDGKLVRTFIE